MSFFGNIPPRLRELFLDADPAWNALDRLERFITAQVRPGNRGFVKGDVYIEGDVEIGAGTVIEPGVVILGPAIIGENCTLRAGAYVREQVVTGAACVIGHGSEVVRSILMDGVRLDHFNYVGDSILGEGVHLGAGAKTANLRFDMKSIAVGGIRTSRQKLGVVLGDRCQLGVNVAIGPGVLFAKDTCYAGSHVISSGTHDPSSIRELVARWRS